MSLEEVEVEQDELGYCQQPAIWKPEEYSHSHSGAGGAGADCVVGTGGGAGRLSGGGGGGTERSRHCQQDNVQERTLE